MTPVSAVMYSVNYFYEMAMKRHVISEIDTSMVDFQSIKDSSKEPLASTLIVSAKSSAIHHE